MRKHPLKFNPVTGNSLPDFLRESSFRELQARKTTQRALVLTSLYCFGMGLFTGLGVARSLEVTVLFGFPLVLASNGMRNLQLRLRKAPFAWAALILAVAYTLLLTVALFDILFLFRRGTGASSANSMQWLLHNAWWMYPLFFLWVLSILAFRGVARKIGPGVFRNWIRGYYHQPRSEMRIFMFLDMRGSTMLAEQLGNQQFGALLRDFMYDLSDAVAGTKGEISHYIGDEAVLMWPPKAGFSDARCIQCFFRFQADLESRRAYYQSTYGVFPGFKAGVHYGEVIATEVGDLKSEIVFIGDVVNTTARIQAMCNDLGTNLLISADVASKLPSVSWLRLQPVGEVALRGKALPVSLVAASLVS
jgi:class 3 adenylate cyclase